MAVMPPTRRKAETNLKPPFDSQNKQTSTVDKQKQLFVDCSRDSRKNAASLSHEMRSTVIILEGSPEMARTDAGTRCIAISQHFDSNPNEAQLALIPRGTQNSHRSRVQTKTKNEQHRKFP